MKLPSDRHVIEDISFRKGVPSELAPIQCACGWLGQARFWADHRKDATGSGSQSMSSLRLPTCLVDHRPEHERVSQARGSQAISRIRRRV